MSLLLRIDPIKVASKFGFSCAPNTSIDMYISPPEIETPSGHVYHSLLVPKNAPHYLCMWCSRSTVNPIGLPIGYCSDKNNITQLSSTTGEAYIVKEEAEYTPKYSTYGVFCCLQCVKAYWLDHRAQPQFLHSGLFIEQIWRAEGPRGEELKEAPPRELLSVFGGSMDYDKYHTNKSKPFEIVSMLPTCLIFRD